VRFGVSEPVPAAEEKLVIGGKHRMRIIQPRCGRSTVIHKAGYSRLAFEREVGARRGPAAGLAPRFHGVTASGLGFEEEYFAGTPANRMVTAAETQARETAVERLVSEVHRPTLRVRQLDEHVAQICAMGVALCPAAVESLQAWETWLRELAPTLPLGVCFTHGDFQDANILVQGERLQIIDWEAATERSQLYDLATLDSQLRLAPVALEAWQHAVSRWLSNPGSAPRMEVMPDGRRGWLAHAAVWWLEDTMLRLEESRMAEHLTDHRADDAALVETLRRALAFLRQQK
jgi:hypothetical protein